MIKLPVPWLSMRSLLVLLALVCSLHLHAQQEGQMQVFASHVDSNESAMTARGDVLILYQDYYLSAEWAQYDRQTGVVELFDNVTVMKGAIYHMLGNYVRFDMRQDKRDIEPFYLLEKESRVWVSCEAASAEANMIDLDAGMVSGCDPNDPIWKVRFSSSDYNLDDQWLNLYNARIVIGEVPVFYLPYFGYSLDTTRRTGLLLPSFGLSDREGFYYEQPIYIAEQNWWDLELRPQIRTNRGEGLYGAFRFVDSKVSQGSLNFGFFKEKTAYFNEYSLENNKHHGLNFRYVNSDILKEWMGIESSAQSGAYFDVNWMNDIEYINLKQSDETLHATTSQVFSRINLLYDEEKNYVGSYFKYYLDLEKDNNDETIQNLPTVQYHRYLETWLDDRLFYNVDLNVKNYYRKVGTTAQEVVASVPVTIRESFFDDYLDVSLTSQLYGKYIVFEDEPGTNDSGRFGRSTNTLQVGSFLTKGYEDMTHSMGFDVLFVQNGFESKNGYFEEYDVSCELDPNSDACSYYKITAIEETTQLQFVEYLYGAEGEQLLYHRLTQSISSADKLTELENELEWQVFPALTFYSDTIYDHEIDTLTKQATTLRYLDGGLSMGISHFFEDKARRGYNRDSSYLTSNIEYRYNDYYNYFAKYAYDLENSVKKSAEIGFLYSKRCWDFGLRYVELNRPVLQSGGVANSIFDKYIYFTIILKPMGGSDFQYQLNDVLSGS
jgi:LPS-assembly protein